MEPQVKQALQNLPKPVSFCFISSIFLFKSLLGEITTDYCLCIVLLYFLLMLSIILSVITELISDILVVVD